MNIFKILANGDGTINEANISAFLGYLLDPYQDHGLGFEFLKRFISKIEFPGNLKFNPYKCDFEVLFEQAFRDEDKTIKKKEIIDIVILCFESNRGMYKEIISQKMIDNKKALRYVFLIENKVGLSPTDLQLSAQYNNFVKFCKDGMKDITPESIITIFLTPDNKIHEKEFENFTDNPLKHHFLWSANQDQSRSLGDLEEKTVILEILKSIIEDENFGRIEPINEYTKHTLIAFIQFIQNGFKSEIQEKTDKTRKSDGSYTNFYVELNHRTNIFDKLEILREKLIQLNPMLNSENVQIVRTRPPWPSIKIYLNEIVIELSAGYNSRDAVSFIFRCDVKNFPASKVKFLSIAEKLGGKISMPKSKDIYCRTLQMEKARYEISDLERINTELHRLIAISV